jgi:hypothetical protein
MTSFSVQVSYGGFNLDIKVLWGLNESFHVQNFSLIVESVGFKLDQLWLFIIITVRVRVLRLGKLLFDTFFSHFLGFGGVHVGFSGGKLSGTIWVFSYNWNWIFSGSSMSWEFSVPGVMHIINGSSENWLSESVEFCLSLLDIVFNAISVGIVNFFWHIWLFPVADWLSIVYLDGCKFN